MKQKRPLLPLFSVVFVDMLGFGLILPLLPYIAANWGARPAIIGLIGAAYPLGQFFWRTFGRPFFGSVWKKAIIVVQYCRNIPILIDAGVCAQYPHDYDQPVFGRTDRWEYHGCPGLHS